MTRSPSSTSFERRAFRAWALDELQRSESLNPHRRRCASASRAVSDLRRTVRGGNPLRSGHRQLSKGQPLSPNRVPPRYHSVRVVGPVHFGFMVDSHLGTPDVAYYYPAPYWSAGEGGWIKSLLLFFDQIAILLPDYMQGRHIAADPMLAGPLEDRNLLQVLEPNEWVDQTVTEQLCSAVIALLEAGLFDDLSTQAEYFQALSQSRMGYGADIQLAGELTAELFRRGFARESEDGVSIPLHPAIRTTILVILAQLARSAGERHGLKLHPVTSHFSAAADLQNVLSRSRMPSAGHVVSLDLETVSLDLENIPLDEVLGFREAHGNEYRAYARSIRGFVEELSQVPLGDERERLLAIRSEEMDDAAHTLHKHTRRSFAKAAGGWAIGIAGAAWSLATADPLGEVRGSRRARGWIHSSTKPRSKCLFLRLCCSAAVLNPHLAGHRITDDSRQPNALR